MGCYGKDGDKAHDCPASGERWEDFADTIRSVAQLAGFDGIVFMAFKRDNEGDILHASLSLTNAPVFCSHELSAIRDIAVEELEAMEIRPDPVEESVEEDTIGETKGEA